MSARPARLLSVLVAAMGGEGGGVLANWIVAAAERAGLAVQATSIPGVAQRTGATTYYIEIWPAPLPACAAEPVFALYPTPGEVDLVIASELVEAARAVENGYVTPDRTALVASTHRVWAIAERAAMGDGRTDPAPLLAAARDLSARCVLADFATAAKGSGAALNAVMLGAAAASGALPVDRAVFRAAIEAEGKAVASNLAGFAAGESLADAPPPDDAATALEDDPEPPLPERLREAVSAFPAPVAETARLAVARLLDYQDEAYAELYLSRLAPVAELSGEAAAECARQLALRMSYEDVIRVAQLKTKPSRLGALRAEAGARPGEPVRVREFLKPGLEEWCALLPPALGGRLFAWATKRGVARRFSLALRVRSDTVLGFALLRSLAALKPLRRRGWRWREEQRRIDDWLALCAAAARRDAALGVEVAALAGLVKGYGETWHRGFANYGRIVDALVRPWLAAERAPQDAAPRLRAAREAATADPEGRALAGALAAVG